MSTSLAPHTPEAKVARFKNLLFWAERGLIRLMDMRPEQAHDAYRILSVDVFMRRVRAKMAIINRTREDKGGYNFVYDGYPARKWIKFIEDAIEIAQQARNQGEPSNPEARRDLAARRPTRLWVKGIDW